MKSKLIFASAFALGFLLSAQSAFADPIVQSFTVSSPHIISSQVLSFSWTVTDGKAPYIKFSCPIGVRLSTLSGSTVSCNTQQTFSTLSSDGVDLIVTNTSGAMRTLYVTIIPNDLSGTAYPSLSQTVSSTIDTDVEPITIFSDDTASSSETVTSSQSVTFTWKARGTTGVNFLMNCVDGIVASSSSYSVSPQIPCGMTIFSPDLANTGTLTLSLNNKTNQSLDVKFTILPAMDTGMYDATHAKFITITVLPYALPKPVVNSFVVSSFDGSDRVFSGVPTTYLWNVSGASAVNLKSTCTDAVSITVPISATSTETVNCGDYIFPFPLSAVGSTTMTMSSNSGGAALPVSIQLVPYRADGTYDATSGKSKTITVLPPGAQVQNSTSAQSTSNSGAAGQTGKGNNSGTKYTFTKTLSVGSRNTEVTNLQTFLKKFPDLYPEGLVTGYYGPATARAVGRFQIKYGIAKSAADVGYGGVGPKTRLQLNALQ